MAPRERPPSDPAEPLVPRRTPLSLAEPNGGVSLQAKLDIIVENQVAIVTRLDQQNVDMVALGLAMGRIESDHRRKFESVPEIVDERMAAHDETAELQRWRGIKAGWRKVALEVLKVLATTGVLYLIARLARWL